MGECPGGVGKGQMGVGWSIRAVSKVVCSYCSFYFTHVQEMRNQKIDKEFSYFLIMEKAFDRESYKFFSWSSDSKSICVQR